MTQIEKQLKALLGSKEYEKLPEFDQNNIKEILERKTKENEEIINSELSRISEGEFKNPKDLNGIKLGSEYSEIILKILENALLKNLTSNHE
ncbi:MAG: hypothetical protein RIA69_08655 [Cyclobacteriaceae bacterium]